MIVTVCWPEAGRQAASLRTLSDFAGAAASAFGADAGGVIAILTEGSPPNGLSLESAERQSRPAAARAAPQKPARG